MLNFQIMTYSKDLLLCVALDDGSGLMMSFTSVHSVYHCPHCFNWGELVVFSIFCLILKERKAGKTPESSFAVCFFHFFLSVHFQRNGATFGGNNLVTCQNESTLNHLFDPHTDRSVKCECWWCRIFRVWAKVPEQTPSPKHCSHW